MPNNIYNDILRRILNSYLGSADIRAMLLMANTTADTEKDAIVNVSDITTLDESDDSTYARVSLASEAITADDSNDLAKFDAADITFSSLTGDGTRDYTGVLIYEHVDGTNANDILIVFLQFPSDQPLESTSLAVAFNANGILTASQA